MLLDEAGFEVIALGTADEALAFTAGHPDLVAAIFTDIQMPGQSNGLHLAEVVGRHWPEILVLVTSGRVAPSVPLPENVRFLPKPWLPLEVLTAMQRVTTA